MQFRPYPGLTIATAIALAILIALGTWQYQRLGWKQGVIAEITQAANAPAFSSLAAVEDALAEGQPVDFRRVSITADILPLDALFMVYTPGDGQTKWRAFGQLDDKSGAPITFFAGAIVADNQKDAFSYAAVQGAALAGYVRVQSKPTRMGRKSNVEGNRYYGFNPVPEQGDWADLSGRPAQTDFYVDLAHDLSGAPPDELPVKMPEIRNNHFDYMLTWYGLALTLLVIYVIKHQRDGRLFFRPQG